MNSLIIMLALSYITHNPSKLLDNPDQQAGMRVVAVQRFNLQDNDCIIVTLVWKQKDKWVSQDLEVWICGNHLYGPYGTVGDDVLFNCVWRHKKWKA